MVRIEVIPNRDILNIKDYEDISYTSSHGELFREFCREKNLPIHLPYIGGQYWMDAISKLGHIAIMEDSFGICVYSFYQLDRYQRDWMITKKPQWKNLNFSGVIMYDDGRTNKFDQELLKLSNELVVEKFVGELTTTVIKIKKSEVV